MADVRVTCIEKPHPDSPHEHITHLGNPAAAGSGRERRSSRASAPSRIHSTFSTRTTENGPKSALSGPSVGPPMCRRRRICRACPCRSPSGVSDRQPPPSFYTSRPMSGPDARCRIPEFLALLERLNEMGLGRIGKPPSTHRSVSLEVPDHFALMVDELAARQNITPEESCVRFSLKVCSKPILNFLRR
jgi:hypothetical protein